MDDFRQRRTFVRLSRDNTNKGCFYGLAIGLSLGVLIGGGLGLVNERTASDERNPWRHASLGDPDRPRSGRTLAQPLTRTAGLRCPAVAWAGRMATMIERTEEQRRAVMNGEAIRVPLPDIGDEVVLLRAAHYEHLQQLLKDEREEQAILRYSMGQAVMAARKDPYEP